MNEKTTMTINEDKSIEVIRHEVIDIEQTANDMVVRDAADYERLTAFMGRIAKAKKALRLHANEMIDPLKAQIKNLKAKYFDRPEAALEAADAAARSKGAAYLREQENKRRQEEFIRRQEQQKREAEARKFGEAAPEPTQSLTIAKPPKTVKTEAGSATAIKYRDYDVVDLDAVPVKYIKKEIRRQTVLDALNKEGIEDIPGLRVREEFRQQIRE